MPETTRASDAVAGVVLAAGASTRMGQNKLLLQFEGETLLRRAARLALESGLDPVIVVLGHQTERARRELGGLPVLVEVCPAYREGMSASLRAGVSALPADAAAAVVTLADMPLVTADMLAGLLASYRKGTARLVVSSYGGIDAPPVLYDRSLFAELLSGIGDAGGRDVVRRHRTEADVVRWPASALRDLDVPADYEGVRAGTQRG